MERLIRFLLTRTAPEERRVAGVLFGLPDDSVDAPRPAVAEFRRKNGQVLQIPKETDD